jgi:hypothetical protein
MEAHRVVNIAIWLRLAIATTNDLMINQYCSDRILFSVTCFSPHGTIIIQRYMNTSKVTELLIWIRIMTHCEDSSE